VITPAVPHPSEPVPTYDYRCRQCGTTYEVIHPMTEQGPTTCERCGGELRRVLHPAGIIFKGSGFYKTDARAAGTSKAAKSGTSQSSSSDGPGSDAGSASSPKPDASPAKGSNATGGSGTWESRSAGD
jgi:putative FmdB family regulatory protein